MPRRKSVEPMYRRWIKRLFDLLFATVGLLLAAPLLFAVGLALWLADRGSGVFFVQSRPGLGGRIFRIVKFRTMTDERDASGRLLPDGCRLTRLGALLRSTSLDELPQLYNVLRGDMSLVGPRPLLPEYLPRYTARQARRHEVRPGITGWAQCHGRNATTWDERLEQDVWYVEHLSAALDLRILLLTVVKVVRREGIGAAGAVTKEPFRGKEFDGVK